MLFDLDDAVAHLDDVDHLGLFELPRHCAERAAAARTDAIGIIELEHALIDRQRELLGVSRTSRAVLRGFFSSCWGVGGGRRPCLLLLGQRLDQRERLLQLGGIALERLELFALSPQYTKQLLDLDLLRDARRGASARCLARAAGPRFF